MKRSIVVLTLLASLTACGPMGNTLGLDGLYKGALKLEMDGTYTEYQYDPPAVNNVEGKTENDTQVTIAPGYSSDAVVTGLSCPIPLMVSGNKLVIDGETECNDTQETDFSFQGNNSSSKKYNYTTYSKFDVESLSNGSIRVAFEAVYESEQYDTNGKTSESKYDAKGNFEGNRVAEE